MERLPIAAVLIVALIHSSAAFAQNGVEGVTVTRDAAGQPTGVTIDNVWVERICFTDKPPRCGPVMQKISPEQIEEAKKQLGVM